MRIICGKDYSDVSNQTAQFLAAQVRLKPDCVLGLATGGSPVGTYAKLVELYRQGTLDFSKARTVNLDEYVGLAPDHPQSYAYYMRTHLFDHVNLAPGSTFLPDGLARDGEAECARYDALLQSLGGTDMQLLGLGNNGHIGFNEPGDAFCLPTHRVALTESTVSANARFFASREEVPRWAYTMGIGGILSARKIVMVVTGAAKAQAVRDVFFGPVTPKVPGSVLQLHKDVILIADREALSLIPDSVVVDLSALLPFANH